MLKREILGKDAGLSPRPTPVTVVESWQRMGYLNWRCPQEPLTWVRGVVLPQKNWNAITNGREEYWVDSGNNVYSNSGFHIFLTLMPRKKRSFIIRTYYLYTVLWVTWEADSGWRTACNLFIGEYSGISTCERTKDAGLGRGRSWIVTYLATYMKLHLILRSSEVGSSLVSQIVARVWWPTIPLCLGLSSLPEYRTFSFKVRNSRQTRINWCL